MVVAPFCPSDTGRRILHRSHHHIFVYINSEALPAEAAKGHIEELLYCAPDKNMPRPSTAEWLKKIPERTHRKLVQWGLAEPKQGQANITLAAWVAEYIMKRTDAKPTTVTTWKRAEKKLNAFFPATTRIRDITPGDGDDFNRWLRDPKGGKLSEATARKTISIIKQFTKSAIRRRLIESDPFEDLKGNVVANRDRDYVVSREEADAVLAACPDAQWRALFVLARYAALRIPSEALALRWQDVDWAGGRFTVHSSKTEHHAGGGFPSGADLPGVGTLPSNGL